MQKIQFTNLKLERLKKGLTQQVMAEQIGIARSYLSMIETLTVSPSQEVASKIEKEFNKPMAELLTTVTF